MSEIMYLLMKILSVLKDLLRDFFFSDREKCGVLVIF